LLKYEIKSKQTNRYRHAAIATVAAVNGTITFDIKYELKKVYFNLS